MITPNKICNKCAPILIDYHHQHLLSEENFRKMKTELERASFSHQLSEIANSNLSGISYDSPTQLRKHNTEKLNRMKKDLLSTANTNKKESQSKASTQNFSIPYLNVRKSHDSNVTSVTMTTPSRSNTFIGVNKIISGEHCLDAFENEINKKIESFKKKLFSSLEEPSRRRSPEPIRKSLNLKSQERVTVPRIYDRDLSSDKPKFMLTTPSEKGFAKCHDNHHNHNYNHDTETTATTKHTFTTNSSGPVKVTMESEYENHMNLPLKKSESTMRFSETIGARTPIQPKKTNSNIKVEIVNSGGTSGSGGSGLVLDELKSLSMQKGELSSLHKRSPNNYDYPTSSTSKYEVVMSDQNIKEEFKKQLEDLKNKSLGYLSKEGNSEKNQSSPFFSPLKASDLMNPNAKSKELDFGGNNDYRQYKNFIMPTATPLLNNLLSSQKSNNFMAQSTNSAYRRKEYQDVTQFDKESHNFHTYEEPTFNRMGISLSKDLLSKEDTLKEASLDLSKKFEEELKYNGGISRSQMDQANDPFWESKGFKAMLPPSSNNNSGVLKETGEFGSKQQSDDYFTTLNDEDTLTTKTLSTSPPYDYRSSGQKIGKKLEESPDIDRLQVRQDRPESTRFNISKWYKLACLKEGKYYSTDGEIEYVIGQTICRNIIFNGPDSKSEGGIYVFNNIQAALKTRLSKSSRLYNAPKALLRVNVHGPNIKKNSNTYLYSAITPIEALYIG
jgi:hypothetical protein